MSLYVPESENYLPTIMFYEKNHFVTRKKEKMVNIQLNLQNNHFQKAKKKKTRWHKIFFFFIFEEISSKKINFFQKKTKKMIGQPIFVYENTEGGCVFQTKYGRRFSYPFSTFWFLLPASC